MHASSATPSVARCLHLPTLPASALPPNHPAHTLHSCVNSTTLNRKAQRHWSRTVFYQRYIRGGSQGPVHIGFIILSGTVLGCESAT